MSGLQLICWLRTRERKIVYKSQILGIPLEGVNTFFEKELPGLNDLLQVESNKMARALREKLELKLLEYYRPPSTSSQSPRGELQIQTTPDIYLNFSRLISGQQIAVEVAENESCLGIILLNLSQSS